MRYFTKELWLGVQDCDKAIREQAEKQWEINDLAYEQEFAEVKKHLPGKFVKNYLSRNGFHGYTILDISIFKEKRSYFCKLKLSDGEETVLIEMDGIKALLVNVNSLTCCIQKSVAWGYDEFEITPYNSIKLSVLCDVQNELQFEFENIRFSLAHNLRKRGTRGRFA